MKHPPYQYYFYEEKREYFSARRMIGMVLGVVVMLAIMLGVMASCNVQPIPTGV